MFAALLVIAPPSQELEPPTNPGRLECPRWTPEVEEMARIILSRTSIAIWQVDYAAQTLAVDQPDVALKLVRAKLDFILEEAKRVPPAKPYPEDGTADEHAVWYLEHRPTKAFDAILETMEWNGLPAIAEAEPATFVASLWPWYADLFAQIIARANRDEAAYVYPGQYILELDFSESTSRSGAVKSQSQLASNWPLRASQKPILTALQPGPTPTVDGRFSLSNSLSQEVMNLRPRIWRRKHILGCSRISDDFSSVQAEVTAILPSMSFVRRRRIGPQTN